jgi:hypothetical protein
MLNCRADWHTACVMLVMTRCCVSSDDVRQIGGISQG